MRFPLTALLLCACGSPQPPPEAHADPPALPFDQSAAAPLIRLEAQTAATVILPVSVRPDGQEVPSAWTLGPTPPDTSEVDRTSFTFDLPMPIPKDDTRFRPDGMAVIVNGTPLAFDMAPMAPGHRGWRVKGDRLLVVVDGIATTLTVTLSLPRVLAELRRLDPTESGLTPADYITWTDVSGDHTQPGLLLPAGAAASWLTTLPEGARLDAAVSLLSPPLGHSTSDGARVTLTVTSEAGSVVAGHRDLATATTPAGWWPHRSTAPPPGAVPWRVDLTPWAGQTVTITLETSGGAQAHATPTDDYVFVGAPIITGDAHGPPRHVVIIAVDTLRPDHLGTYGYARATSPELDAFADASVVFERVWSPAPRTRPSFRSATTGRGALDAVGAPNMGRVFASHGFATAGFVANIHLNPRFGFADGFDLWHLDPTSHAATQVDAALAWQRAHDREDTFLFLHFMDPHLHYKPPEAYRDRFLKVTDAAVLGGFNRWTMYEWMATGQLTEDRANQVEALYDGEIAYTSHEIGRFLEGLDALPGTNAVVFHSDHGEEFWEHGGFEHNHALWDEVTRAALWMRLPAPYAGVTGRRREPAALWDIAPTLYALAGFTDAPPTDGRSLLPLALDEDQGGWDRALPVAHLMYDREQWGVVWRDHKYKIATVSGDEHLYDLTADPWEQTDIASAHDLTPYRAALSRAHGMPVGPGWHIELDLHGDTPVTWHLPAPALGAAVLDPEAARTDRANLVWGEVPPVRPEDVASVSVSDDGRTLTIVPGPVAHGTVAVLFAEAPEGPGRVTRAGEPLVTHRTPMGWRIRGTRSTAHAIAGTVVLPPPGEFARMGSLSAPSTDSVSLLQSLGYITQDAHPGQRPAPALP